MRALQQVPDTYPANAVFGQFVGTYSEDRQTVCIMAEDNQDELTMDKDTVKEIAWTVKTLITNMGCEVHTHTMKAKPFCNLTILKPRQL